MHSFSLDGGHPSLDFANTLDDRFASQPAELIPDYQALLAFVAASGMIAQDACNLLSLWAEGRPREAAVVHATALSLRASIYAVASALVDGLQPDPSDLDVITRISGRARAAGQFVFDGEGFRWSWENLADDTERPLWQLADAAIELFTREDLTRLRICAANDCGWIFLDETKNRSRKWCDMATCGNRAKAARYRERWL